MLPRCLVTVQNKSPRTVRILPRGNFLDETGEIVAPATPGFLGTFGLPSKEKLTRLDLADWILSAKNPLTARTVMNRTWKQFFGVGMSKVLDDLGAQGAPPSNPALMDFMAVEFRESGWDTKHMVRLIVTSATYKQVSTASKSLMTRDPENREFARQSRPRLEAEEVRDTALQLAGLLVPKIGGPSVRPYQPERYWENLNFPVRDWMADKGESQWRRGLYTWWQRSFLHPSMLAFDARGVRGRAEPLEHPAAGTRSLERPDLCRSGTRIRCPYPKRRQGWNSGANHLGIPDSAPAQSSASRARDAARCL